MYTPKPNEYYRGIVEGELSLSGLRTVAPPVLSPSASRKAELLVKPKHHKTLPPVYDLLKYNGTPNADNLSARYAYPIKSDGLNDWVRQQQLYLHSLSLKDEEIIKSYTMFGDTLVNNFSRGTLHNLDEMFEDAHSTFSSHKYALNFLGYYLFDQYDAFASRMELPPQLSLITPMTRNNPYADAGLPNVEFIVNDEVVLQILNRNRAFLIIPVNIAPLLASYKQDLIRIIASAPRLSRPLVVYRGFKSEKHMKGLEYENVDFVSTSISATSALRFSNCIGPTYATGTTIIRYACGMYEITIDGTIPCIYMEPNTIHSREYEILLSPGLHFSFSDKIQYKIQPAYIDTGVQQQYAMIQCKVRPIIPTDVVPYVPKIVPLNPDVFLENMKLLKPNVNLFLGKSKAKTVGGRRKSKKLTIKHKW